ncbi:enolase [Candidatus Woesearchaeota archaeon]|jgi:enolase|nr:enolase [Candidatus Woesearchaeota archaeon]MBT7238280.1 enolase [Candidatus Woesearchaeota archaeon]
MIIKKVKAKVISNSRGEDTIKVQVKSDLGKGEASAPSGASKGKHEVKDFNFNVKECVDKINKIDWRDMEINSFDDLKLIEDKIESLGANSVIAMEYAVLKAFGKQLWKTLDPNVKVVSRPLGNVIGGGVHVKGGNFCEFQEFLLFSDNAKNVDDLVKINDLAHNYIKKHLKNMDLELKMTDEGAWALEFSVEEILDLLKKIVKEVLDETGVDLRLGIDVAANSFWDGKNYVYRDKKLDSLNQLEYIGSLIEKYDLRYLEDPLHEEDFSGFAMLNENFGKKCMITGDDLIVTNVKRLEKAIEMKSINAMIVKPNQNGSLLGFKEVVELAKKEKLKLIISHRSGETLDDSLVDLGVGFKIPLIKCGVYGKERKVKLDRLRKISKEMKYEL